MDEIRCRNPSFQKKYSLLLLNSSLLSSFGFTSSGSRQHALSQEHLACSALRPAPMAYGAVPAAAPPPPRRPRSNATPFVLAVAALGCLAAVGLMASPSANTNFADHLAPDAKAARDAAHAKVCTVPPPIVCRTQAHSRRGSHPSSCPPLCPPQAKADHDRVISLKVAADQDRAAAMQANHAKQSAPATVMTQTTGSPLVYAFDAGKADLAPAVMTSAQAKETRDKERAAAKASKAAAPTAVPQVR